MAAGKAKIPQLGYGDARPAPVVLISGPERFLADRTAQTIRDALRAEDPALEIHDIEAAAYGSGELFTIASPSLFAEPRLIRVDGVEKASDAFIADAKRYLEHAAEGTTLVLRHGGGQRGRGLLDAVRGEAGLALGAVEVVCAEIKRDGDRLAFAQAELRRLGAQLSPAGARALVAAYAGDLGELAGAIGQLVSDRGQRLSEEDVERATEGRVEAGAFKVADAATAGNVADALFLLRQALLTGTDAIPLLAALNMKVRAMARVFAARGSAGELAKTFGMAPWQVERAQRETRGWREADLARAVDLGAQTEWLLKGGSRDPEYALERYVLFIARRGR
ncbi:DNA polymerase III subunit delta [Leucobacter weissii]|uniref:DNA-directed DNA polymerase n=1 Tax=Leucobacter weissii TaxID=1983706 RepID=A0A939MQS3_9MICO|nr:DNA polymerase III subunit delta [Leucobacter weissii]